MDGSCLASPRWVSLLVAELFYPHARFPATRPGTSFRSFSNRRHSSLIPPVALPPADITYIPRSPTMEAEVDVEEATTEEEGGQSNDEDQSADRSKRNVVGDKGAGAPAANKPTYCDGVDEIGCFQVLYEGGGTNEIRANQVKGRRVEVASAIVTDADVAS
jgi:hypothetical protein